MKLLSLDNVPTLSSVEKLSIKTLYNSLNKEFSQPDFIIFGSKARGDFTEDSDLDLAVILEAPRDPKVRSRLSRLTFESNLAYDTQITSVLFDKAGWLNRDSESAPLRDNILREGLKINV